MKLHPGAALLILVFLLSGCGGSEAVQNGTQFYSLNGNIIYENTGNEKDTVYANNEVFFVKMLPDKDFTQVMNGTFIKNRREPGEYPILIKNTRNITKYSATVELIGPETTAYFAIPYDKIVTGTDSTVAAPIEDGQAHIK